MRPPELARLPSLRLVLLNAYDSDRAGARDGSSVAGEMIPHGMPAVLGMRQEITDQAALEFSRTFYAELAVAFSPNVA